MIDLLFDQFQRYNNVAKIINNIRKPGQVFTILEVGANEHQNLERFLPEDQITYLDIQLPEDLKNNPKYLLGDATAMVFPDNHYNIVVALDVFEHIAEENRVKFISEIHRVSSELFVITAPFHSEEVVEAERRVNAIYKTIFNKDFIWLEEHMMNGLPHLDRLTDFLKQQNIEHKLFSHGDLEIWEKMMTIHFIAAQDSRLGIYRNEIDRYYNQHIFENDYVENSYRKICVGAKSDVFSSLNINHVNEQVKNLAFMKLNDLERKFYVLAGLEFTSQSTATKDYIQIFLDSGEGFSESNSVKVELIDERQIVECDFNGESIKFVRIDPSNTKGTFEIKKMVVKTTQGKTIRKEDLSYSGNFNFEFKESYVFFEDDPFIIFEFNEAEFVSNISFEVSKLSKDETPIALIDFFNTELDEYQKEVSVKQFDFEDKISKIKEENVQIKKENSKIKEENSQIKEENSQNKDEAISLTHKIKELFSELERYKTSNQEYLKSFEILKIENKELEQKNKELNNNREELIEKNLTYSTELKSIYTSRSWIYLSKLKKMIGR